MQCVNTFRIICQYLCFIFAKMYIYIYNIYLLALVNFYKMVKKLRAKRMHITAWLSAPMKGNDQRNCSFMHTFKENLRERHLRHEVLEEGRPRLTRRRIDGPVNNGNGAKKCLKGRHA